MHQNHAKNWHFKKTGECFPPCQNFCSNGPTWKLLLRPMVYNACLDLVACSGPSLSPMSPCGQNIDDDDIHVGFVLCQPGRLVGICRVFTAQLLILECKNIISGGYQCVLHLHALIEECSVKVTPPPPTRDTGLYSSIFVWLL